MKNTLGKKAYDAYWKTVDFTNFQDGRMPKFEDLTLIIQSAWENVAKELNMEKSQSGDSPFPKKFEQLDYNSDRLKIAGGWIVRSWIDKTTGPSMHSIFISDPEHKWEIE